LLTETAEILLSGDLETAKAMLRDTIKATIGYRSLTEAACIPEKSLIRMFGPRENPRAAHLSLVIEALQRHEDVRLELRATRRDQAP
jgi:hypothetical protein